MRDAMDVRKQEEQVQATRAAQERRREEDLGKTTGQRELVPLTGPGKITPAVSGVPKIIFHPFGHQLPIRVSRQHVLPIFYSVALIFCPVNLTGIQFGHSL